MEVCARRRSIGSSRKRCETLAPAGLTFDYIEIGDLPLYNEDVEAEAPPAAWTRFRDAVKNTDALLFFTPEYNRSVPGALKNAIDVGSRPYGKSVFAKKPAGVVSVTPGALGAFGANHHLRQSLVFLDVPVLQQPEMYIAGVSKLLNEDGSFADAGVQKLAQTFIDAFAAWVEKHAGK